ncbi:vomeronasal type-1 receptor 4 [Nycticebus coucang]|uniref:vomeronasal type-1 receptor 4 n=1 Tax=Nycticebus coucang TaxID=9470 RepID=UPI00234DCCEC|nr:vomeronasal type-1 receptor 4 [Nycticebus coucang]
MASRDVAMGVVCLSQMVGGVLGNSSLLYRYLFLYFTGCRLRPTDLIVKHLIAANFLSLLSKGIPETMAALGLRYFLNDIGCKLVFYIHRVGRGMSISTTCLLSVFQVITICPRTSRWAKLKAKAAKHVGLSILLCWILYTLLSGIVPMYMTAKGSKTNLTTRKDLRFCSVGGVNKSTPSLCVVLLSLPDVFCLGLMLWASSSMIFILFRHKQQVQHIRKNNLSPRSSPESRATWSILVLVSTFVSSYILSCLFHFYIALLDNPSILLANTATLIAVFFPTVCPFILMSRRSSEARLCFAWIKVTKSPKLIMNM